MNYLLLLVGFAMLIKGADFFVDSAQKVAIQKFKIPSIIVGLTIVSLGTSLPELAISVTSSLNGSNDMAVANVLGSNVFNILMILGATALISPVVINKKDSIRDYMVTLFSTIVFVALTFVVSDGAVNMISRLEGILLVLLCVSYIVLLVSAVKKSGSTEDEEDECPIEIKMLPNLLIMVVGVASIAFGGDLVVKSASAIGLSFGMSQSLVGLTIASVGTSLPELVTSVVAAKKGENDIALGNVLGSCIFNILLIIGVSSTISPIAVSAYLIVDFLFLLAVMVLLGLMVFSNKKEVKTLKLYEGILFISIYVGYMMYIILRS